VWRSNSFVNNKTAAALSVATIRFAGLSSSISPVRGMHLFSIALHHVALQPFILSHQLSHVRSYPQRVFLFFSIFNCSRPTCRTRGYKFELLYL
jgi:hypothetical protein